MGFKSTIVLLSLIAFTLALPDDDSFDYSYNF